MRISLSRLLRRLSDWLDDPTECSLRELRQLRLQREAVRRDAASDYSREVERLRKERFGDVEIVTRLSPESRQLVRDIEIAQGIVRQHATSNVRPIRGAR